MERQRQETNLDEIYNPDRLRSLGLVSFAAGIQFDLNTVPQRVPGTNDIVDGHKCDHNCLREHGSGYDCPASFTRNKGLKSEFPPKDVVLEGFVRTIQGLRLANQFFLASVFENYIKQSNIPTAVENAIKQTLEEGKIQVNLFGGNPEMYKDLFKLAEELKNTDTNTHINLTTTGRKSLVDPNWVKELVSSKIDSISLSCDDIDIRFLKETSQMTDEELKAEWLKLLKESPLAGSKQKALEAIYTARKVALESKGQTMPITFNLVIHHGNLNQIEEITDELVKQFPTAKVNPFPAQSSMEAAEPTFEIEDMERLEQVIDWAIKENFSDNAKLVPRIHYYLMLKAAFDTYREDPEATRRAMSGYGVWFCFKNPGVARYTQVGAGTTAWQEGKVHAGGHKSCYWNPTVTDNSIQVSNESPVGIMEYVTSKIIKIAEGAKSSCAGCIMPRLTFDLFSQEMGMGKEIIPAYRNQRKMKLGF